MNCKHFKRRSKNYKYYLYCAKLKKEITLDKCKNCKKKEYKTYKQLKTTSVIRKKTPKLAKLERGRYSIITQNICLCTVCQNAPKEHLHEIYAGSRRKLSMKWGLCIPICHECHSKYQNDKEFNDYWYKIGQKSFMKYYNKTADEFREIFGKNYL